MSRYVETTMAVTVVRCWECPHWFGFADDAVSGWEVARVHEKNVHRGEKQALRALNSAKTRRKAA